MSAFPRQSTAPIVMLPAASPGVGRLAVTASPMGEREISRGEQRKVGGGGGVPAARTTRRRKIPAIGDS